MSGNKLTTTFTKTVFVLTLALLVPQTMNAAGPNRDPQALALLAQCGAAMGSGAITDSYATGTLTTPDPAYQGASITIQAKGAAERFDISNANGNQTYVVNAGQSWAVRGGKREHVPYAVSAYHHPEHVPGLACVLDAGKPNMSFVYVGQEQLGNTAVHHIRVFVPDDKDNTNSLISELNIFLDTQTLVVLKTARYAFDPEAYQNHSVWETYYGDYRAVGAVLMPFHIVNYIDGHKVRDVVFNSVQVNVGVPDSQFQDPGN